MLTISALETQHGDGWANTPGAHYGIGSGNVGAIHKGGWDGPVFPAPEKKWNPDTGELEEYEGIFRLYDSIEDGFADLDRLLARSYPKAVKAAEENRWHDVSGALYDEGYYTGVAKDRATNVNAHRASFFRYFPAVSKAVNADMRPAAPVGGTTRYSTSAWIASAAFTLAMVGAAIIVKASSLRRLRRARA